MKKTAKKTGKSPAKVAKQGAPAKAQARQAPATGMKKQYLKSGKECKVTFRLPGEAARDAAQVTLVGDFNGWDEGSTPLKKLKDGTFTVTLKLEAGHDYRFRYLIDGSRWENDWCADRYEQNEFASDDSIVVV